MRGNQKNKNYKPIWTAEIAYTVGLLVTDGNLSKDKRHIDFTSKDIELVRTFKSCLDLESKIGKKTSGFSKKKYYRIQFSHVKFYNWLKDIGLTANKSKTISFLKISNKYFADFVRGHYDGDGGSYGYWDSRWPNSFMFYTNFASASEKHIRWLRLNIEKFFRIKGHISKSRNLYILRFAKKESKTLYEKIYYEDSLPCLKRKKDKLLKHIQTEARVMEPVDIYARGA